MRIIAGEFRSRKLLPPESDATRPITDRVKQSLFDILSDRMEGAIVYDCFAGTGSLGLESLSRGAKHATFFESDRSAIARLRQNIAALKLEDRSTLVAGNLFDWFAGSSEPAAKATLIFVDPPYRFLHEQPERLRHLSPHLCRHLDPEGLIIFRHSIDDALSLPGTHILKTQDYGSMRLEFLATSPATL